MTGPSASEDPAHADADAADAAERRGRRERLFGDVLPDRTTDESDTGDPGRAYGSRDDWLRGEVPPHHG